jgi:tetratricopeptide (TPR) repeat protein
MKRIHKIVNEWTDNEEIKSNLLKSIKRLINIEPGGKIDPSEELLQLKNLIEIIKSNFGLNRLIEFAISFNDQLIKAGKINSAKYTLNALLIEKISDSDKVEILLQLADIALRQCKWDECLRVLKEVKILSHRRSDNTGSAKVENILGIYHGERGEIDLAKDHFKLGLSLLDSNKNQELIAHLESNMAVAEIICHNFVAAEKHMKNGLNAFPVSEDNLWLAEMIHNYGMLHLHQKNYQQAIEDFNGAIDIAEDDDHLHILTLSKAAKALALVYSTKIDEGLKLAKKSLKIAKEIDDKLTVAENHKVIGVGERAKENYKKAQEELLISYNLNVELNNKLNAAESAFEMAILFKQIQNIEKSDEWYKISIDYFEGIGARNRLKELEDTFKSIEL